MLSPSSRCPSLLFSLFLSRHRSTRRLSHLQRGYDRSHHYRSGVCSLHTQGCLRRFSCHLQHHPLEGRPREGGWMSCEKLNYTLIWGSDQLFWQICVKVNSDISPPSYHKWIWKEPEVSLQARLQMGVNNVNIEIMILRNKVWTLKSQHLTKHLEEFEKTVQIWL